MFVILNVLLKPLEVVIMSAKIDEYKIALMGFGTVGRGFTEILFKKREWLRETYGLKAKIVAICDIYWGSIYDPTGLDEAKALELVEKTKEEKILEKEYDAPHKGWNAVKTIKETNANVVVEVTWTNLETGEPGLTHIKTALKEGKHVVTTNKGPIAVAYHELKPLAVENQAFLMYEGTVMSGTPVIRFLREAISGCHIEEMRGILNGTTNFILTKMEEGWTFDDALKEAQRLGYAEADPSGDIDAWDPAGKIAILVNTVMGGKIHPKEVEREGIRGITREDVQKAIKEGNRIKLIAHVRKEEGEIKASVKPQKVPLSHPLANVMDVTNALTVSTDHLGEVTVIGPGAGRIQTGQAVLTDLIAIHRYLTKGIKFYA